MHLLIKTLSQFTFKTAHVKNVCDAYLKLNLKNSTCLGQSSDHHQGVNSRTLRNCYVSACLLLRIPVCGGMSSVIYNICIIVYETWWYGMLTVIQEGYVAYLYVYTCDVPVSVVSGCVLSSLFCGGCASS